MTCRRAQEFLARKKVKVGELVDAKKEKISPQKAFGLVQQAKKLVVVKGKKVMEWNLKDNPSKEEILKGIIGPSGNLRAPTARVGSTLVVGFSEEVYSKL